MPFCSAGSPKVSRGSPYSGSTPTLPITMPQNSDTRLIQGVALAMAMMLTRPRKVAAKNSGWSKASASLAKGGAPKVSSSALASPPVADAAIASVSARAASPRLVIG